jgi:protocatechuate 3,4-dioxygenase beta subunit
MAYINYMPQSSRRLALKALLSVVCAVPLGRWIRAQDLGQFAGGPPPCSPNEKHTPSAPAGPDFKAGSPQRTSLMEPGVTGTRLIVTGNVSGIHCGPIARAVVDFWQADARGIYEKTGFRLRGRQMTDANGAFRLETIVPGPYAKRAPHLHVRVQPPGKPVFTTQLFFPDQPSNKTDAQFRPELLMTMTTAGAEKRAHFNIVLDM